MSEQDESEKPVTEAETPSQAEESAEPAGESEASPVEPIELEKLPPAEGPVAATAVVSEPEASQQPVQAAPPPPPPPPASDVPPPLTPSEERTWAMLANLSVLLNLITGFLGPLVALVIYFVFRDRSPYVRFQAMQAFIFQLIWWVLAGIVAALLWVLFGVLLVVCVGICLLPIAIAVSLMPVAALVYGVVGAIETSKGKDFRYWLIGDWVKQDITG